MLLKTPKGKIVTYSLDDYLQLFVIILCARMIICDNFMCMDEYLGLFCEDLKKLYNIYVNLCIFRGNKCCFSNKKCFYYY